MRPTAVLAALLCAPALAGCIGTSGDDAGANALLPVDIAALLPYLDTSDAHDHALPGQHRASWNVGLEGWSPLSPDGSLGRYNHVVLHGNLAFLSAYELPPGKAPGLAVVDVSDPSAPAVLGTYTSEFLVPIDVALSEDGRFAAIAGHRLTPPVAAPAAVPSLCQTAPTPDRPRTVCPPYAPAGIELLDVRDPAAPVRVARYASAPSGAHTVKLATIDGTLHAFLASYGAHTADRLASSVEILRHDASVPGGFAPVSRILPERPSGGPVFVHDLWVQVHPVTQARLVWIAYWDGGVVIADVSDVSRPRIVSDWSDFDAATYGNVHFVRPMDALVDGRHYAVAAPEFSSAEHAGETYVLDTTDPAAPRLVATWRLPGDPLTPNDYLHSPHNLDLTRDGFMAIAHYHAGVWVLDLRPVFAGGAQPLVLGYHFTVPPVDAALETDSFAPNVWAAAWTPEGRIVASDIGTGLYVLAIDALAPGTPPYAPVLDGA